MRPISNDSELRAGIHNPGGDYGYRAPSYASRSKLKLLPAARLARWPLQKGGRGLPARLLRWGAVLQKPIRSREQLADVHRLGNKTVFEGHVPDVMDGRYLSASSARSDLR